MKPRLSAAVRVMSPRSSPETNRIAEIEPSKPFVRENKGIVGRMWFISVAVNFLFRVIFVFPLFQIH